MGAAPVRAAGQRFVRSERGQGVCHLATNNQPRPMPRPLGQIPAREKGASETILDGSETRFLTGPLRNKVSDLGLSETRNSGRLRNKGRNKALSETRAEQGPLRNKGGLGGGVS